MKQNRPFVMLVDDDEVDAFIFRKAFAVVSASVDFEHLLGGDDLMSFLDVAKSGAAAPEPKRLPNVILLDINMPAMNGFQVLRNLREDNVAKVIPVVMFTTSQLETDVERAYREGANSYFVKPSTIDELKRFVASFDDYWFHLARLPSMKC